MEIAFLIFAGLLAYTYVLFPLGMAALVLFEHKKTEGYEPVLTLLIPARDEAALIAAKLANTLASAYAREKLRIVVAADGNASGTDAVVRALGDHRIRLIASEKCEGKTKAVNRMAEMADTDILVLTDADVLIEPDALRSLVRHFRDPDVGAVCARRSTDAGCGASSKCAEQIHNWYEGMIKRGEGVLGRVIGADGALYALRKTCFRPVPPDAPDDFVCILRILAAHKKVAYAADAVAREQPAKTKTGDFTRRRRTVARGIRGLWHVRALLNPWRFPLTFFLLCSHKILRWLAGFMMIGLLLTNIALSAQPVFLKILALQVFCYALVVLGLVIRKGPARTFLSAFRYFGVLNLGAVAGVLDVLRRRDWTAWEVLRETT